MAANLPPHFIKSKILDCGQAMIYRYLDEHSRQIIGFKKELEVDDAGQIYFSVTGNFEEKYCGDIFPVELFFYKKGKPFYMTAKGLAVKSLKQYLPAMSNTLYKKSIVRVIINTLEYSELAGLSKPYFGMQLFH